MKWKEYCNRILSTIDNEAYYMDELASRGVTPSRHGLEIKCTCPFPELHASGADKSPSFTINLAKGTYYCNACGSKGNVMTYYMKMHKVDKETAWYALGDALGIPRPETLDSRPAIDPGLPSIYHSALMKYDGPLWDVLQKKRGLSKAVLKQFCIGWDGTRVTIPIYNEYNELVNIRRYMWNSPEDMNKMVNYVDALGNTFGENRIYGIEHLYNDDVEEICWCEGEWDRIVAEGIWGIPTCTMTAGARNFNPTWYKLLRRKKRIYIAFDNDEAGEDGATDFIRNLRKDVECYKLMWPTEMPEKYDITDLHTKEQFTKEQFLALFKKIEEESNIPIVNLSKSTLAQYTNRRIRVPALVAGKTTTPYVIPKTLTATCEYFDAEKKGCSTCIFAYKPKVVKQFSSKDSDMLLLIECQQDKQEAVIKKMLGISTKCPCAKIESDAYQNLELVQLVPKADTAFGFAGSTEYCTRMAYTLSSDVQSNKRYMFTGFMHADPNTQRATHIFDDCSPEKDLIEEFEMTPELFERLKIFQPAPGQSVSNKMNEIHSDLERNVTYVWERKPVAYATDLVYHSVLNFTFQEQRVKRGWCECLIIGDSGQAKTTLVERLMQHYGLGELLNGESTKRTGLVYNLKQAGETWMLNWGAMPLNDGGLLTVDELSGMPTDDLARMSDVRSSGIAKAAGVVTGETLARTRMIFMSNPRSGRQLKSEPYGVNSILKLFGAAEDVRRLDFAIGVASGEVSTDLVNRSVASFDNVPHVYTSDICKQRVLWAWSRRNEDVIFTPEAVDEILEDANKMGAKYSSRIPLVEAADQRIKLARLSVSVACCMFSTEDGENVIVTKEHVDFVYRYLNTIYDSRALGYDRFSAAEFETSDTTDAAMQRLRNEFIALPIASQNIVDVAAALCQLSSRVTRNAIADTTGLEPDELRLLLPFLIKNSIIEAASDGAAYYKTHVGREFLESILLDQPTNSEIESARFAKLKGSEI
ncbi:MAG: toprim domain-containing protein [Prevotella sp.]|nr:toprim domain-containing protein [Prevotella sp.]